MKVGQPPRSGLVQYFLDLNKERDDFGRDYYQSPLYNFTSEFPAA